MRNKRKRWSLTWGSDSARGIINSCLNLLLSILLIKKKLARILSPILHPKPTDDIFYHETRKPFVVPENISEESFECLNYPLSHPKPAYVFDREEISELLSCISSFTKREPPRQNMGVLFSATQWIPIKVDENPSRFFMARLLYNTLDTAIARILYM